MAPAPITTQRSIDNVLPVKTMGGAWNGAISSAAFAFANSEKGPSTEKNRYLTGEHIRIVDGAFGNNASVLIKGVSFTRGQLSTLPDFFSEPDNFLNLNTDMLQKIRSALTREAAVERGELPALSPNENAELWDTLTSGKYVKLALKNSEHFSALEGPRNAKDKNNRNSYEKFHRQALKLASEGNKEKAEVFEAYALHFLTDAFASGYLFNKQDMLNVFTKKIKVKEVQYPFSEAIAARVWASSGIENKFKNYKISRKLKWMFMKTDHFDNDKDLAKLYRGIIRFRFTDGIFPNIAVKTLHDYLNEEGLEVRNSEGTWVAYGDGHLDKSTDTQAYLAKAISASYAQFGQAKKGQSPDLEDVWKYAPQLTAKGRRKIDLAVANFLDPENIKTVDAVSKELTDYVPTMLAIMDDMGLIGLKNNEKADKGKLVVAERRDTKH